LSVKLGDALVYIKGDRTDYDSDLDSAEKKTKGFVSRAGSAIKSGLGTAFSMASGMLIAQGIGKITSAIGEMVSEVPRVDAMAQTFDKLIQSVGGDTAQAMQQLREATRGMVSDADLLYAGNKFLAMGLAESSDEAAKLAEVATQLGLAMGEDVTYSMENFALMLANQSIPRLDSFGISSGKVRERIKELMEADSSLTRETAFMTATLEQAELTMAKVGEQGDNVAASQARMKAKMENAKIAIGRSILPMWQKFTGFLADTASKYIPLIADAFQKKVIPFLQNKVMPILEELGGWLGKMLPKAIKVVSGFITSVFIPSFNRSVEAAELVISVVRGIIEAIQHFLQWGEVMGPEEFIPGFASMPEWLQGIINTAFEIMWGIVAFIQDTLIPGIQEGMEFLSTTVIPIIVAVAQTIMEKLNEAIAWVQENWTMISTIIGTVLQVVYDTVVSVLIEVVSEIMDKVMIIVNFIRENWDLIQQTIVTVMTAIATVIGAVLFIIYKAWEEFGDEITAVVKFVWDLLNTIIEQAMHLILGIIKVVMLAINGDWSAIWTMIKDFAANIWNTIKSVVESIANALKDAIIGIISALQGWLSGAWSSIKSTASATWTALKLAVESLVNNLRTAIKDIISNVQSWLSDRWNDIKRAAADAWEAVKAIVSTKVNTLKTNLQSAFENIKTVISNIWDAIKTVISRAWEGIKGIVSDSINAVLGILRGIVGQFEAAGRAVVDAVRNGIANAWDGLVGWFKDKLNDLRNMLPFSEPKAGPASPLYGLGKAGEAIIGNLAQGADRALSAGGLGVLANLPQAIASAIASTRLTTASGPIFNIDAHYAYREETDLVTDIQMLRKLYGG